tara:strand:- start:3549 stop:3944 length:396 start_codon:yes stop_codon:yes gene_type:complete
MAKLKNTSKIFDLSPGQAVTVGHNRTITRTDNAGGFSFECRLHGHPIMTVDLPGAAAIAKITLNTCGYPGPTTRDAMADFARAFGLNLSVSFARNRFAIRFKNAAGVYVDRAELALGNVNNGPFALGRYAA